MASDRGHGGRRRLERLLRALRRRWPVVGAAGLLGAVAATMLAPASGERSAPAPDRAAGLVPVSARAYVALRTDARSLARMAGAVRALPALEGALAGALDELATGAGAPPAARLARAAAPWLGREAALALLGTRSEGGRDWVLVLETRDEAAARGALARLVGSGSVATRERTLYRRAGGRAYALADGFALLGSDGGVRAALDAAAGRVPALAGDSRYRALRDGLPHDGLARVHLSGSGLRELAPAAATALAAAGGGGDVAAAAVALALGAEHGRIALRALTPGPGCPPGEGAARLGELAPAGAAAYVALSRPDCAARALARAGAPGAALARLGRTAAAAGVDPRRHVGPLLARGAALVATGDDGEAPALTLLAPAVDAPRALDVLAALQPGLAELAAPLGRGQAPGWEARRVDGVDALTAHLAPGLELSYAARRDRVAVSTALEGLEAALARGGLARDERVRGGLADRPGAASAVVFVDLDRLLGLAERADVASGGAHLAARDDLQRLDPVSGVVRREGKTTTAELLFQNP